MSEQKSKSSVDPVVSAAGHIVKAPASRSTAVRYSHNVRRYESLLKEMGIDPTCFDSSGKRNRDEDPVAASLKLILQRCGPKEDSYEGLKASSTGGACKSAIVSFWRAHGHYADYTEHPDGSFSGNPGKCPAIQDLINKLEVGQRRAGTHKVTRAYQQTHEDVRSICTRYFDTQIEAALRKDCTVDYNLLQAAVLNCCQFGSVSRADEILAVQFDDLYFSNGTVDSAVCAIIQISKTKKSTETYLTFERAVHRSFCPLEKILVWLSVLKAHGITSGPIFVMISGNRFHPNRGYSHSSYQDSLKEFSKTCGIQSLQEHSARRGGLGYQYFVLKKDLLFLYRAYSWDDLNEMIRYLGLTDTVNSYALLGFSCLRINETAI